jgi:hypothetical protein
MDANGSVPSYNPAKYQIYLLMTPSLPRESGANQIIQLPTISFSEYADFEISDRLVFGR